MNVNVNVRMNERSYTGGGVFDVAVNGYPEKAVSIVPYRFHSSDRSKGNKNEVPTQRNCAYARFLRSSC